eukprot:11029015-Alexandrium_andersonii.AAC.1
MGAPRRPTHARRHWNVFSSRCLAKAGCPEASALAKVSNLLVARSWRVSELHALGPPAKSDA